jgi:hypothetical protein
MEQGRVKYSCTEGVVQSHEEAAQWNASSETEAAAAAAVTADLAPPDVSLTSLAASHVLSVGPAIELATIQALEASTDCGKRETEIVSLFDDRNCSSSSVSSSTLSCESVVFFDAMRYHYQSILRLQSLVFMY